ncbi:MAG: hypothetical protein JXA68_06245 [Ignavibacteriales bacterium]|nr:hypothetical protein [Ignavibacteriales bacterium]
MTITKKDIFNGLFIYSIGDIIASLIINQFFISRLLGICFIGAFLYAVEIPNYFRWIDRYSSAQDTKPFKKSLQRTGLALLYFNPLWISRHLLFINLFSQDWNNITWNLLSIGLKSFLVNIPISFIANYLIQNKISYKYRFISSAIFSSLMAIYYALSHIIFK